jgi:hypothetical protein
MESLNGIPTRAQTHAGGAASSTTQVLTQVMQLEEALAAVSKGISDRIAAAAVEVESRPADSDLAPPSREVARLEDVLKISAPAPASVSVPPPAAPELEVAEEPPAEVISIAPPTVPTYVAAQALREAFWFEQASAFSAPPATPQEHEQAAVEIEAPSCEPEPEPEADASGWLTAIILLTLLALVMVLTGRRPRR